MKIGIKRIVKSPPESNPPKTIMSITDVYDFGEPDTSIENQDTDELEAEIERLQAELKARKKKQADYEM